MEICNYIIFKSIRIILKRIIRIIKKHKFLFSILLVTFLYFIFSYNCFAFTVNYDGVDYDVPEFPFDTDTYSTYIFGYRNSNRTFIVGYPVNTPVNNKIFCSPSDALDANIYRYYRTGTTYGEWYWYDISRTNLTSWSSRHTSSHGFLGFYTATIISSVDIYESPSSSTVYFTANADNYFGTYYEPRFISTVNDLQNNTFNNIEVYPGSFADTMYLKLYDISNERYIVNVPITNYDYYLETLNNELIYNIPYSAFPNFTSYDLVQGHSYRWEILYTNQNNITQTIPITFTIPITYTQASFISTSSDIQNVDNTTIKIFAGSFADVISFRLYNLSINTLIFNLPLSNFDNYIERENLENPFSRLIYNIPYSALPSFNYVYDENYEYRLVYTNENDVLCNISLFFTPTINEGINQITNDDINNSIITQTQQQHEDSQEIKNSIITQTQQQHEDSQEIKNAITDSTEAILSTEADEITLDDFGVQSPTIEGSPDLTNIFNLLYSSFMEVYEDNYYRISFGLPGRNDTFNLDLPTDAISSKLPPEFLALVSVFWWVVLGGFVLTFIVKIIRQIVTYSNGSVDKDEGGFLSELQMTPTEYVLFNILH